MIFKHVPVCCRKDGSFSTDTLKPDVHVTDIKNSRSFLIDNGIVSVLKTSWLRSVFSVGIKFSERTKNLCTM
jgi:hypothetical protein